LNARGYAETRFRDETGHGTRMKLRKKMEARSGVEPD
jgi:hypothetical protein